MAVAVQLGEEVRAKDSSGGGGAAAASSFRPLSRLLGENNVVAPPLVGVLLDAYNNTVRLEPGSAAATLSANPHLSGQLQVVAATASSSFNWSTVRCLVRPDDVDAVAAGLRVRLSVSVSTTAGDFPGTLDAPFLLEFCPAGRYASRTAGACAPCEVGYFCRAGQERLPCPAGTFTFTAGASSVNECVACGDNVECADGVFRVQQGSWADLGNLTANPRAYECQWAPSGCQGASFSGVIPHNSSDQCSANYQNARLCARCAKDFYFLSSINKCQRCTKLYKRIWVVLFLLVCGAWVLMNVLSDFFESTDVILTEMQFLTTLGSYNLSYFQGWINAAMIGFQLSLFDPDFLGPDCVVGSYGYVERWMVAALLPLLGVAY
eukprot:jgi/Mesen1/8496/ME000480S07849